MKLTWKDFEFIRQLKQLADDGAVRIEYREDGQKRLVLRQPYGTHTPQRFGMTRQGIRWRFNHILNETYVAAYETILLIETAFSSQLRNEAMAIAKQRADQRKRTPTPTKPANKKR